MAGYLKPAHPFYACRACRHHRIQVIVQKPQLQILNFRVIPQIDKLARIFLKEPEILTKITFRIISTRTLIMTEPAMKMRLKQGQIQRIPTRMEMELMMAKSLMTGQIRLMMRVSSSD